MSRSKRKPYVVDGYGSNWKRFCKRYHNRIIRQKTKNLKYEIEDGCSHKRGHGMNQWDICDYKWYEPATKQSQFEHWTPEEQLECHKKYSRK